MCLPFHSSLCAGAAVRKEIKIAQAGTPHPVRAAPTHLPPSGWAAGCSSARPPHAGADPRTSRADVNLRSCTEVGASLHQNHRGRGRPCMRADMRFPRRNVLPGPVRRRRWRGPVAGGRGRRRLRGATARGIGVGFRRPCGVELVPGAGRSAVRGRWPDRSYRSPGMSGLGRGRHASIINVLEWGRSTGPMAACARLTGASPACT